MIEEKESRGAELYGPKLFMNNTERDVLCFNETFLGQVGPKSHKAEVESATSKASPLSSPNDDEAHSARVAR